MAEGRELGKLVIAESLEAASRPGGAALRKLFVQAVLGDEQHKHPLVWEALDEAIFESIQARFSSSITSSSSSSFVLWLRKETKERFWKRWQSTWVSHVQKMLPCLVRCALSLEHGGSCCRKLAWKEG